ncbi:MAG: hypothetical protein WD136_05350 [Cyanobium sp.]
MTERGATGPEAGPGMEVRPVTGKLAVINTFVEKPAKTSLDAKPTIDLAKLNVAGAGRFTSE